MKISKLQWIITAVLFVSLNYLSAQKVYTGLEALKRHKNTELVRESKFSSLPSYIKFKDEGQIDIDDLAKWMNNNFRFDPNISFMLLREDVDILGHVHYRFQQTYYGRPIEDAIWIAHTKADKVYSLNGLIYDKIPAESTPVLSEDEALNKAKDFVGASVYKWELPIEEQHIKWEQNDPDATFFPTGEQVMVSKNCSFLLNDYRLAYKFNIYAHAPLYRAYVYVDAITGEVIRENKLIYHADEEGTAHTAYSGAREIIADSHEGEYRLRDASRGDGVRTFDMNEGTFYGDAVDFIDDDNDWNNVNPEKDEYATDAHWGAEMTYDYFLSDHDRNSIDNAGFQLNSYVHYSVDFDNAFWDGERMTYGDGNVYFTPLTGLDVCGHEVTHGLTTFTANLVYADESGALNESFSDIFGTAIEHFGRPEDWDWLIGLDIGLTGPLRSMSNPNSEGDPDTYFGDYWAPLGGGDSGGVHTNSGVQNFWYYLLSVGGTGTNDNGDAYDVESIGIESASAIAFRNLTVYLTTSSQFNDARFYSLVAAEDLFGGCSFEVQQTGNAWYAVGVGEIFSAETTADFVTSDTVGCTLPFTANFTNLSLNAMTYTWDFGDGGTSTDESPSHTYTEEGTYTVTLTADGEECGTDAITKTAYIVVDPTMDCVIIMPESGGGSTQTSCEGTLFDSGGPDAQYGAAEDSWITIAPFGASSVNLSFVMFDIEEGSDDICDYDYLEIYDGPSDLSPLIGRYCNTVPPSDITSTGGAITLVFHSDNYLEENGFEIEWSCEIPVELPDAEFTVNSEESCSGLVYFTDLTTNAPIEWLWEFGDGSTSTEQNPEHTYAGDGTYTVSLTATNIAGEDVEVKTDYIVVNSPENPIVSGAEICEDEPATLVAAGAGTIKWYEDEMDETPVHIGPSFITPALATTTSYWVEDDVFDDPQFVGPPNNSFAGGGNFAGDQHMIFNNPTPVTLKSVKVYANGAGNRTIELRDNDGSIIESKVIYIPDGESVVTLDLALPVGSNLQLGTALGSTPNLYRNNDGGTTYPYILDGSVEIINSSAGDNFYYFFYDWEIHTYECVSDRVEAVANVSDAYEIVVDDNQTICIQSSSIILNASETGGTWSSTCGDCIDEETGEFNPALSGEGSWVVTYSMEDEECLSGNTLTVNVVDCLNVGDEEANNIKIYPNPTKGNLIIDTKYIGGSILIKDIIGKTILRIDISSASTIIDLNQYNARGTYFVEFYDDQNSLKAVKKVVKH